jgi:hypothetical protein
VDLVIEAGLHAYDICAPIAVIEAAGGIVTDWEGGRSMAAGACWPPPVRAARRGAGASGATGGVTSLLIRNAGLTSSRWTTPGRSYRDADIRIENGEITELGQGLEVMAR